MKLQNRIFRLNMFMLIISLVAMLGVSLYVVENMYLQRQSSLSISQRITSVKETVDAIDKTNFQNIASTLAQQGAHFVVSQAGSVLFSNTEDDDEIEGSTPSSEVRVDYQDEDVIISKSAEINGITYDLYAILEEIDEDEHDFKLLLIQLMVIGGVMIVLVVGINYLFSRRILQVIMNPLNQLDKAVSRIQAGDFETPIVYQGDKEFERLTDGFNHMQVSLQESQKKNQLYEQNRTKMVADISHDLRTPLTSIKGYAKGILDGVATTQEKQQQYTEVIYQKAQVMESLLDKLFVFAKLGTDNWPLQLMETDLKQWLLTYVEEQEGALGPAVKFDTNQVDSLVLAFDNVQFRRVLDNLLDNTLKYAGVSPILVTLVARRENEMAHIIFKDNGGGVEDSQLGQLFEEFYRVDEARQKEGHGLGLSIVAKIIHRHAGRIYVEQDNGLAFHILLPIQKEGVK